MENLKMGYENEVSGHSGEENCSGYNKEDMFSDSCGCEACTTIEQSDYFQKWYEDCAPDDDGVCLEFCSTVEDYETFVIDGGIEEMVDAINDNVTEVSTPLNCGIHVHVDLQHYTLLSMYNAMRFMNTSANNTLIFAVCNREDGRHHNIRDDVDEFNCGVTTADQVGELAGRGDGRVRTTCYKTLEYRTFLSSTDAEEIKRFFQFAHAMTIFSRPENFLNSPQAFTDFVKESEDYPILTAFLESESIYA